MSPSQRKVKTVRRLTNRNIKTCFALYVMISEEICNITRFTDARLDLQTDVSFSPQKLHKLCLKKKSSAFR